MKANGNNNNLPSFGIGDFCRAVFTDDNVEYEGILETLDVAEDGREYGTVKFLGYGNAETHWIADLKPSLGNDARDKQVIMMV